MEKLPKVAKRDVHIGCLTCSTVPDSRIADMDTLIAVGFGSAYATKNGDIIYDGERDFAERGDAKTVADIEKLARKEPDADWRIVKYGPMHGETYQRQGKNMWVMVESNDGFA